VSVQPTSSELPDSRVDELRQRLRALGYLDASVDRFVLGPVRRTRTPTVIAVLASLRIGLLAALLLGPAAAVGITARVPGLITGPRDGLVAAMYLGILFGLALTVTAAILSLGASWAAKRGGSVGTLLFQRVRSLSTAAGAVVSTASLIYLTLWWRTADVGSASLAWTAFALAVAAAISITLGHAVMVTATAVTLASPGEQSAVLDAPLRSWKASLGASLIAFVGASALLYGVTREFPHQTTTPQLAVASSGARVVVLAIDGFTRPSPDGQFSWLNDGRADLAPLDSSDPARLWTTIGTGVRPENHGVTTLQTRRISGLQGHLGGGSTAKVIGAVSDLLRLTRPAIASNFERRVKTFWEVAEAAGLKTAVVNWWATWPAPAAGGIVISDRAIVRLDRGGALDAELSPASLYERLKSDWPRVREIARNNVRSRLSQDALSGMPRAVGGTLIKSAELDAIIIELAKVASAQTALDLLVVYLPGLDIAQHTLLTGDASGPPSEINSGNAVLDPYYAFLGELTREWAGGQGRRVFIVAQPGRSQQGPGTLLAQGPGLQNAARISGTPLDVAPTILHALGLPVARDLDGSVLSGLFTPESLLRLPVRYVSTYGRRGAVSVARGNEPLDQEVIDRLRSLGYVK
jgi:hypothetical protein